MTHSPLLATLIPLIPLAGLGWPLARVLNQNDFKRVEVVEEVVDGPLIKADLLVRSAHPFQEIKVKIGEATWTFAPDEDIKEVHFSRADEVTLLVTVTWPDEIESESAAFIELRPEGKLDRSRTLWGFKEVTEEIKFVWGSGS